MNEDALRALIREAVARHLTPERAGPSQAAVTEPADLRDPRQPFPLRASRQSGGPCLIEPAVTCNHCGYCQSHGH